MEQNLHHPSPRLPDGWKGYQSDNIDIIPSSEINANASGRHSRSPSVLSDHHYPVINMQMQQQLNDAKLYVGNDLLNGGGDDGVGIDDDLDFGNGQFTSSTTTTGVTNVSTAFGQSATGDTYIILPIGHF